MALPGTDGSGSLPAKPGAICTAKTKMRSWMMISLLNRNIILLPGDVMVSVGCKSYSAGGGA
jgi:hypothetical protein